MMATTAGTELRDGWTLVLACGTGFGLGLSGLPFYTYGVFVGPLRETFGWNMAVALGSFQSACSSQASAKVVASSAPARAIRDMAASAS